MKTALLLIAHGSREANANDDLHAIAESLRATARYPIVEPAFLELAEPTIEMAAQRCVEQGAQRVILLPFFLSAGVHVRRDLGAHQSHLAQAFPGQRFALAEPLGPDPRLSQVLSQRALEAEASLDQVTSLANAP
jgi:sirohydrochlorin ferrochelatase